MSTTLAKRNPQSEIEPRKPFGAITLPENEQWRNRFQIRSETSNRLYTIAQNKKTGKWACSCLCWITRRKLCKHLAACGLTQMDVHGGGIIDAPPSRKQLGY